MSIMTGSNLDQSSSCLLVVLFASLLAVFCRSCVPPQRYPSSIEWIGRRKEPFSYVRACLREYKSMWALLSSGYQKFSRAGRAFVMPRVTLEPMVVLPQEHIQWLVEQPVRVLSELEPATQRIGLQYVAPKFDMASVTIIFETIRFHLHRNLGKIQGNMIREIRWAADTTFGVEESWTTINLSEALRQLIFRSLVLIIAGEELCRNDDFVDALTENSKWVGGGSILLGQYLPVPFRWPLGLLLKLPINYYRSSYLRHLRPVFRERLASMERSKRDPGFSYTPPNDMTTWFIRTIWEKKNITKNVERTFEDSFALLLSAAFMTTVTTATHSFLDLLGSDPEDGYYQSLRDEADFLFKTEEDWTNISVLSKMVYTDSALRESLRRGPPVATGLWRQVMHKDGATLPNGQHLSQGVWIAAPLISIHHDERFYQRPDTYEPFRFVAKSDEQQEATNRKKETCVTTSDTFLSFGHGRLSCGGRQFATNLLKLLLAHITTHYDIKPLGYRPANKFFGEHPVPPSDVMITVRRRKV